MRMTPDEIEVRLRAFVVICLTLILVIAVLSLIYAITFVDQSMELAPIDKIYSDMLKDIMLLCIGSIGGIATGKAISAVANQMGDKTE
jgi:hypothetical protein